MISRVLIDMDGVLCDFMTAALAAAGINAGHDSITDWNFFEAHSMSEEEFWQRIDNREITHGFWSGLQPYEWCHQLIRAATLGGQIPYTIATSPSRDPNCAKGKVEWIQKHLGQDFRDFVIGPRKSLMAREDVLLIDDSDQNVEKFAAAGGRTILFPQPWNANREWLNAGRDRIDYVVREMVALESGRPVPVEGADSDNPWTRDDAAYPDRR